MDLREKPFIATALPMGVRSAPNELIVSCCLNINKYFKGFSANPNDTKAAYDRFYGALQKLRTALNGPDVRLTIKGGITPTVLVPLLEVVPPTPFQKPLIYLSSDAAKDLLLADYERLRDGLWDQIFPGTVTTVNASGVTSKLKKELNPESRIADPPVGSIVQMTSTEELPNTSALIAAMALRAGERLASDFRQLNPSLGPDKKLEKIYELGRVAEKRALFEKFSFIKQYPPKSLLSAIAAANISDDPKQLAALTLEITRAFSSAIRDEYLSPHQEKMDIDEVIHSFGSLSNEPLLMRLMGLMRDFEVVLPSGFVPTAASPTDFCLSFELPANPDTVTLPTRLRGIRRGGKYAYLVAENDKPDIPKFFDNSILKVKTARPASPSSPPWQSHLYLYDKVAQELRIKAANDTQKNNSGAVGESVEDSFTRGIVFGNTGLAEMLAPAAYPFVPAGSGVIPDDFAFSADFVSHGHRVGVVTNGVYYSLTGRRSELKRLAEDEPFFASDHSQSPIHFDAVANYLENGQLKSATTDALFEYAGELLGLKSAFSRTIRRTGADDIERQTEANDDGGLYKSRERIKQVIDFTYFPQEPAAGTRLLNCHYDIPKTLTPDHSPRLRFSSEKKSVTYTFVVYEEYLNGWALPLVGSQQPSLQLTVEELTERNDAFLPPPIEFYPLEPKKPVLLFHTKEFNEGEDSSDESVRPIDRESLEALVVWSNDADSRTHSCSRHVLPARIAFEHAFWYGLLSQMSDTDESFEWKKKYNCPFVDEEQYNLFTKGDRKEPCPEDGCKSYCGGTRMRSFYPELNIVPNHLSDPSIIGFRMKFFRDRDCTIPIDCTLDDLTFGGTLGLAPQSYLLNVDGSDDELTCRPWDNKKTLDIRLKKGMRLWARLENIVSKDYYDRHLKRLWYHDLKHLFGEWLADIIPAVTSKNPPRTISLVHAVKTPVVDPKIAKIFSTPAEDYKYKHIAEWLKGEYEGLTIQSNVIAQRLKMHEAEPHERESSRVAATLEARFERLDAFVSNNRVAFVPEELPTGSLELWTRKEEFIDDPDQIVLDPELTDELTVNHLPDHAVVPFDSDNNIFHRDHKVDFTPDVINQLKTNPVTVADPTGDIFREAISTLKLNLDARSTIFEERRYKLRNTSLFKGYFTGKEDEHDDDYKAESPEFRVLLLNNKRCEPPQVSHAVTTIREVRSKDDDIVTSTQKGNLVTIYLKRGRLTSGKAERVGVVVYNESSNYHQAFRDADLISKAGRDIVSDQSETASPFIRYYSDNPAKKDIVIPEGENEFEARYEKDLGLVSYLPKFDLEKQLWKFEVELDIKTKDGFQLHNPFVQFSLVHFQPFSLNYNANSAGLGSTLEDIKLDFRISPVEPFIWCYLLPERKLSVSFDKPGIWDWGWTDFLDRWGSVDLTIWFDNESLHRFNRVANEWMLRSNFILSVEGSNDKISWYSVMSQVDDETGAWKLLHPLLKPAELKSGRNEAKLRLRFRRDSNPTDSKTMKSQDFSHFRVRLVEVEWFDMRTWEQLETNSYDLVEDDKMRVRYVELIY